MKARYLLLTIVVAGAVTFGTSAGAQETDALPAVEEVLKRVLNQVDREEANEQMFKQSYRYTRSRKTEFKNAKGEVKKTEAKTGTNDPFKRRAAAANKTRPTSTPKADDEDSAPSETKTNVKGKAFEKSDFPLGDELIKRFDFTLVSREVINGRPALVIDFTPKKKKLPEKSIKEKFINKAAGRVWVDEMDSVPVKANLHLSAPVSVLGGLVGAVQKFTFNFNRQRTPDGIWFTLDSDWHLEGREVFIRRIVDYREEIKDVELLLPLPTEQTPAR